MMEVELQDLPRTQKSGDTDNAAGIGISSSRNEQHTKTSNFAKTKVLFSRTIKILSSITEKFKTLTPEETASITAAASFPTTATGLVIALTTIAPLGLGIAIACAGITALILSISTMIIEHQKN